MTTVTITDLLLLIAVLFILYFVMNTILNKKKNKKETFEQTSQPKTNKACSQTSINEGYLNYTFGGVKFVR